MADIVALMAPLVELTIRGKSLDVDVDEGVKFNVLLLDGPVVCPAVDAGTVFEANSGVAVLLEVAGTVDGNELVGGEKVEGLDEEVKPRLVAELISAIDACGDAIDACGEALDPNVPRAVALPPELLVTLDKADEEVAVLDPAALKADTEPVVEDDVLSDMLVLVLGLELELGLDAVDDVIRVDGDVDEEAILGTITVVANVVDACVSVVAKG